MTLNKTKKQIASLISKSYNLGLIIVFIVASICLLYFLGAITSSDLSLIIHLAIFNFCFILLFISEISFRHSRKYNLFKKYADLISRLFKPNKNKAITTLDYSLLKGTVEYLIYFLAGTIPAILCLWVVYYFQKPGAWSLFIIYFIVLNYYFRKHWKKFIILYLIFFGPILGILLQNDFYVSSLGIGFITGVLLFGALLKNKKQTRKIAVNPSSISHLLSELKSLIKNIHNNIYINQRISIFQGLFVGASIFLILVVPNLEFVLPQDFFQIIEPLIDTLPQIKEYIAYILFFSYSALSFYPIIVDIFKKLSFKDEDNFWKRISNWFILLFTFIFISPLILFPSIFITISFLIIGEYILGNNFVIIIGFFVFPLFGAYLNSFVYLLILFVIPLPILRKFN